MKLFFFAESGLGVARLFITQAQFLNKHHVDFICGVSSKEQEPGLITSAIKSGISVVRFDGMEFHKHFFSHINKLRKSVLINKVDVIHCQTNWQLVISYIVKLSLLNKCKLKLVYTIHGYRNNKSFLHKQIAKCMISLMLFFMADRVIATCLFLKKEFKLIHKKISIVHLGVDDLFITSSSKCEQNGIRMIFPAMFREGKQQELIIESLKAFIDITKDSSPIVVFPGIGEKLDYCKSLVKKMGLENNVIFPGLLNKAELLAEYEHCNIFVCSSISETYCQSLVEAYCLGKCVVSTPVGIASEIVKPGRTGFLFKSKDDLVSILLKLYNDQQLLANICSCNCLDAKIFSWDNVTSEYLQVLGHL